MSERLYKWRALVPGNVWAKKDGWLELSWAMSELDAVAWALQNKAQRMEKIPGSEKT